MMTKMWESLRDAGVMALPLAAGIGVYQLVTMFVPGWAVALATFLVLWRAYYIERKAGTDWLPRFDGGAEADTWHNRPTVRSDDPCVR